MPIYAKMIDKPEMFNEKGQAQWLIYYCIDANMINSMYKPKSSAADIGQKLGIKKRVLTIFHCSNGSECSESHNYEHDDEEELGDVRGR